jgi:hypothetical protein
MSHPARTRMRTGTTMLAGWCLATAAQAEPAQTVSRNLSAPLEVSAVSSYGAPDALDQALARVFFSDGSSSEALFSAGGTGSQSAASASTSLFVIVADGSGADTSMPALWSITNLNTQATLVGFELDGRGRGNGRAAFDVSSFTAAQSTPGSNDGRELLMSFTGRTFLTGSVAISYANPVALTGQAAAGDLFATVRVGLQYTNAPLNGGLPQPTLLSGVFSSQNFSSDVDLVQYLAPAPTVPEPGAALLALAGAGVLAWRRLGRRMMPNAIGHARHLLHSLP